MKFTQFWKWVNKSKDPLKEIYVIDTETTGLDGYPDDVIVEIAICKVDIDRGTVEEIYESIVGHETDSWGHWRKEAWIFGNSDLTLEMVKKAKPQDKVTSEIRNIMKNKYVTSFNVEYDFTKFLCCDPWNLEEVVEDIINCIMIATTPVCAIDGSYGNYKWPKLEEAYAMLCKDNPASIMGQNHRALDDVLMASNVLLSLIKRNAYSLDQ